MQEEANHTSEAAARAQADGETTRAAGRGGLAIAGAKLAFIAFGFAQAIILPRLVGTDGYGQAKIVLAIVSIVNNAIVAVSIQGMSRAVSSAPKGREDEAFRTVLRVHVVLAMAVSLVFALVAGTIADKVNIPHLSTPLRLTAAVVLLYGMYAPLVGNLNGRRRFVTQAALDTGYGALRIVAMALGGILFLRAGASGVLGVFAGFVTAALIIFPIALWKTGLGREGDGGQSREAYLRFLVPLAGGQILLNMLMQTDSILLRYFTGRAESADTLQGIYSGAQQFSFLPYQLLMSVTFILFPMLARAQADGDREAVRSYTISGVRLALLLTALISGTVSAIAPHLLRVVFPREMWAGGDALRILSLGMGAFSVLGITSAALTGLGRATDSALLTGTGVLLIATACWLILPRTAFGLPMLTAAATATSVALTLTAIVGAIRLRAVAGGFVAPLTLIRALIALGVVVGLGTRLPWMGVVGTVVEAGGMFLLGLTVLIVLGEVGKQDLARIKQVAGKKG